MVERFYQSIKYEHLYRHEINDGPALSSDCILRFRDKDITFWCQANAGLTPGLNGSVCALVAVYDADSKPQSKTSA